ncbi:peroxiredoxin [Consotaella salsifontis]|uniref:Glutathione-dependent peroxiredoxin n=1 Tax=Consotaella salsifontis TaxID=1365950 RepID=A0A1T4MX39_9HYPH|nr:peroxiredoxin [Consotaella salsifontis]SJZ71345.1 Peroxiredoxin [Consotaella salsifontis]
MTIGIGDSLPNASFRVHSDKGPAYLSTDDVFKGKKVVLFGVPGAFTPGCTMNHLPGYLDLNAEIRAKGVDTIAVVAVNDVYVMNAWEKATQAADKILFLADGNADFTKAVGLEADMTPGGMGTRSKRYSMIVEDGVVRALEVEDSPGQIEASSAGHMLELLQR